jgi:hypothetical protein
MVDVVLGHHHQDAPAGEPELGIDGRELVDVSRHGLLLHGSKRAQLDRILRVLAVMSDGTRVELQGKVARAFVAGLSKDHVTFGLGLRLGDALEWLDFDQDGPVLDPVAEPASIDAADSDEWVETDSGSGLVVPKHTVATDDEVLDATDCWTLV